MSLLFIDSVGHYNYSQMTTKWTSATGGSIVSGVDTGSTFAYRGTASKTLGSYLTLQLGARQKLILARPIGQFKNTIAGVIFYFDIISDGRIQVQCFQHNSGPFFAWSTYALSFNAEYYIEVYCTMSPYISTPPRTYKTDYTFEVRVNGVNRFSGTITAGPSDLATGLNISDIYFSEVIVVTNDGAGSWAGDFVVTDGEFLGDRLIVPLFPRADGTTIQWTPLSGANWQNVSEHIPDDNTSYNSTTVVNNTDLYYLDLIGAFVGNIGGVQALWRVENVSPGATLFRGVYRNGSGSIVNSGNFAPSTGTYQYFVEARRKSPFTGVDYTAAEIDASQLGLEKML